MAKASVSAARAFAQSAGAKLLVVGLNAATGILSARALQPAGRGELAAMILWYVFLASTFTFGVPSALTYQLRKNPDRRSEILGAAVTLGLLTAVLAMAIGFIGMPHWLAQYDPRVIFFARLFLLNTPISALFLIGRAALESDNDFTSSNVSLIGPPLVTVIVLAVLWMLHRLDPVTAAWAYVPAGLPSFYLMIRQLHRRFQIRFSNLIRNAKLLMSYGIRSYGIDLCGTMALYVDQALVIRILKPEMMGTYVVALSLSRMLNALHTAVVMVLFPKAVSAKPEEIMEMTGRAARLTTFFTAVCGLGIVLIGPQLLSLFYGTEYRSASSILRILVVEVVLSGATLVLSQAFMALSRPGIVTILHVIGLGLTIPLMLVLVPRWGTTGAAWALLLSTCARFSFVMFSFRKFLGFPCPRILLKLSDLQMIRGMLLKRLRRSRTNIVEASI
jgi:O-antigen/teichoic acid export membrane protein